jgi:hypothetical protein
MCNCGNKRNEMVSQVFSSVDTGTPLQKPPEKMWADVNFRYIGQTALTVTGTITGKRYRFSAAGEEQPIDYRDAGSMMTVPVLKRVL